MTTTMQKVILVVEDHPQNLELVTDLLESAGYRVLTAMTAEEGLTLSSTHRPDLKDRLRIRDAGCEGYLTKPLKIPLLLEQIDSYLGHRTSGVG
jgi:CheY-like chemotaxis protein